MAEGRRRYASPTGRIVEDLKKIARALEGVWKIEIYDEEAEEYRPEARHYFTEDGTYKGETDN